MIVKVAVGNVIRSIIIEIIVVGQVAANIIDTAVVDVPRIVIEIHCNMTCTY